MKKQEPLASRDRRYYKASICTSYDQMGRVANLWQCAPYNCGSASIWSMPYTYDLAGDVTNYVNPAGFNVTRTINAAQQVTSQTYGTNMAVSSITYEPWGAISTMCGGQGCAQSQETRQYNNRLQPTLMELGSQSNLTADYCLVYNYYKSVANPTGCALPSQGTGDNGNIIGKYYQANAETSYSQNVGYTYDGVNRLLTAVATGNSPFNLTYNYDQYGNGTCVMNGSTQGYCPQYSFNSANNHITNTGYNYDAAGDLLWDGGSNYEYDAEGRVKHSYSTGQWQYPMYNALGQRVQDYQGIDPMTLTYPVDISGQRVGTFAQWPSQGWTGWNVYWAQVAGQHISMGGADAYIDHSDVIGSTTMETDPAGGVQWKIAYYPWGQVLAQGGIRQSVVFAGLDWQVNDPSIPSATREYNDGLARWLTPDPGGVKVVSLSNPQTWNMYAYVGNNPTSLNDPSGESIELTCTGDDSACAKQRHEELQALQEAVGKRAGSYLYENPVTTIDANGNSATRYYVGIYSGGPSGKGPSFDQINAVAGEIAPIINDSKNVQLAIAPSGSTLTDDLGNSFTLSGRGPGVTGFFGGNLRTYLLDPSTALGPLPSVMMLPPSSPGAVDPGIVVGHELGHARGVMTGAMPGQTDDDSLRIENKIRALDDPNAPIRIIHDCPPGVCQ